MNKVIKLTRLQNLILGLPGGPVVKTLCSQVRGHKYAPWSQNYDSTWCSQKKKKKGSSCLASELESYKKKNKVFPF